MIIFTFKDYKTIGDSLLQNTSNRVGDFEVLSFANGEIHCTVNTKVENEDCVVISSFTTGSELGSLLLAHTLKRLGAKQVMFVAPYIAYTRQDREEPGKSLGAAWAGSLIKASGFDSILTVDLHSAKAEAKLAMPVKSLLGSPIFAKALEPFLDQEVTIISPDEGALPKAKALAESLGGNYPVTNFIKVRTDAGVTLTPPQSQLTTKVVLVDDILDTGGTLVGACRLLVQKGVKDIVICVTHGQFVGEKWKELWSLGVSRIYTTDSLPNLPSDERISVVSLGPLFMNTIL